MESEIVNWTIRTRLCESVKGRGEGEKEVVRRGGGGYLYGGNKAENRSVRERESLTSCRRRLAENRKGIFLLGAGRSQ